MKKILVLTSLFALMMAWTPSFAQNAKDTVPEKCSKQCSKQCCSQPKILTPETVKMLKEAYFKENLKMDEKQQTAFWKSYNNYENAKKQACTNAKAAMEKAGLPAIPDCKSPCNAKLTADQKVAQLNIQLEKRQAMLSAEQTFYKELSKTLNNEQIAQYLDLEKSFQMEMRKLQGNEGCGQHPDKCKSSCKSDHPKKAPQMGHQKCDKMPAPNCPAPAPQPKKN